MSTAIIEKPIHVTDDTFDETISATGNSFLSTFGPIGAVRVMPLRRSLRSSPPTMANA